MTWRGCRIRRDPSATPNRSPTRSGVLCECPLILCDGQHSRDRHGGASAYYSAIAIELGLKAYLLHRGITDQWNRIHLRHDVTKALKCVRRAGLKDIPHGIRELADLLGPLYASGALSRGMANPVMPLPPPAADRAIGELLTTVETIIAHEERGGG